MMKMMKLLAAVQETMAEPMKPPSEEGPSD